MSADPQIALDIEVSQMIIIVSDIMSTIIFFIFLVLWKIRSEQIVESMVSEDALPSYYSLEVRNLPKDYNEEQLVRHF